VPYFAGVQLRRLTYRCGNPLVREREVAHAQTERMRHCVGDRRRRGTLRGFARADGGQLGAVDQLDFDGRYLAEFQDGVILPAEARDAACVELYLFLQRPAGRLNCATFDLIDHAVRVDSEPDVDRKNQPINAYLVVDLRFGDRCAVGAEILVFRKSDAVTSTFDGFPPAPPGPPRRRLDHRPAPRILEVPTAESNQVNPRRLTEPIHEGFH